VQALADDADGIFAHSKGDQGNGNIAITIASGGVRGGAEAAAVRFVDGADNTLINRGELGNVEALNTLTIAGSQYNEVIDNFGTFAGTFDLGAGTNRFVNHEQARLISGATLNVSSTGTLTNSGTWSPGGEGVIAHTSLIGDLTQTQTGQLLLDFDPAAHTADVISLAQGNHAVLQGAVTINPVAANPFTPGTSSTVLMTSSQPIDTSALALNVEQSAVTHYALSQAPASDGQTALLLTMTTNFLPTNAADMQPNQIAAANYINAIQKAGGSPDLYNTVAHIASLSTSTELEHAYDLLTADLYVSTQAAAPLYNISRFSEALLSCKQYDGQHRFVDEGDCAWMNVTQVSREESASRTRPGVDQDTTSVAAGAQRGIGDHWHVGLGFSLDNGESQVAGIDSTFRGQHTTSNAVQLGAVLKGNFGAQTLSTSLVAGRTTYEATRGSLRDAQLATASSEYSDKTFAAHMRYGYAIAGKSVYVRPLLDAGFTRIRREGFVESGSGPTDLVVSATTDDLVTVQPALEMGAEFNFSDGTKVRGTARAGVTRLLSGENVALAARFEGAPEGVAPMTFSQELDKQITEWALGLDVLNANGKTLRLTYSSSQSEHSKSKMGMLKMSFGF
jgi:hypothetical protein